MLFLKQSYRPQKEHIHDVPEKENEGRRIQKWLLEAESWNKHESEQPEPRRHIEKLTSVCHRVPSIAGKILVILGALALVSFVLHQLNCRGPSSTQHHPQALNSCATFDLTMVKNRSLYFGHYNVSVTVAPHKPCENDTKLIVIVHSRPHHQKARAAIRDTWGSIRAGVLSDLKFQVFFLLGYTLDSTSEEQKAINSEKNVYDDLIITTIVDVDGNSTLKTIAMLQWVPTFCPDAKYLMKTDDNVYVNEQLLMKFASDTPVSNRTIYGYVVRMYQPHHDPSDRWYVTSDFYPSENFPNFMSGSSYLMTRDVIQSLCQMAVMTPMLPLEDVFVTGICAEKVGIHLVHHPGMNKDLPGNLCLFNHYMTMHFVKPTAMKYVWNIIREGNSTHCSKNESSFNLHQITDSLT